MNMVRNGSKQCIENKDWDMGPADLGIFNLSIYCKTKSHVREIVLNPDT